MRREALLERDYRLREGTLDWKRRASIWHPLQCGPWFHQQRIVLYAIAHRCATTTPCRFSGDESNLFTRSASFCCWEIKPRYLQPPRCVRAEKEEKKKEQPLIFITGWKSAGYSSYIARIFVSSAERVKGTRWFHSFRMKHFERADSIRLNRRN